MLLLPVTAEIPALITFTSGSSGIPKGTNRTHGFLVAQHAALSNEFPMRDDDIDMPMFPVFALNNLASGIPSIVPKMNFRKADKVDGRKIVDQMIAHGVTTCTASPPFIDRVVEYIGRSKKNLLRLRRILTGGAPVSNSQLAVWRRVLPEVEIVVVYGSTEAEPVAHITADERLKITSDVRPRTPGYCVGRPSSLIAVRIVRITEAPNKHLVPLAGMSGKLSVARSANWSYAETMLPEITTAIPSRWPRTRSSMRMAPSGIAWAIPVISIRADGYGSPAARTRRSFAMECPFIRNSLNRSPRATIDAFVV